MSVLLVYPTHKNCREVEAEFIAAGFTASTYPARTTANSDDTRHNCWNREADWAESIGLPVVKTVCPACQERARCLEAGYLAQLKAVERSAVALCTHKRAEFTGLAELSKGRKYVSVHENPIGILRPVVEISEQDLLQIQQIAGRLVSDPAQLNWFAGRRRSGDDSSQSCDEEMAVRKDRQHQFCKHLADITDALVGELECAERTTAWKPTAPMKCPLGMEQVLLAATRLSSVTFHGQPWRFVLAAATGGFESTAILIRTPFLKGHGKGAAFTVKRVIGVMCNLPITGVTTWFNDATFPSVRLQEVIGRPVQDMTPHGKIECRRKCVQILRDITHRTSKQIFGSIVRGILADRPQFRRVGIICLRPHVAALRELGADFVSRIVKSAYFGSGDDRSSNDWHEQCDLIVVAGTPRVPPDAVAEYLVQVGEGTAAGHEPVWGPVVWDGRTESGEGVRVEARGYGDEAWRRAHREIVRAQLIQAIGRGRGILDSGCEVIVVSTEECGLKISDCALKALNETSRKVLEAMRDLTMENPKKDYLGNSIVSTRQVVERSGLSPVWAREILRGLERRGCVRKVGERQGWALVSDGFRSIPPA